MQEHHLSIVRIASYGNLLKGTWQIHWLTALGKYQRKGGVCLAIAGCHADKLVDVLEIIPGRVQCPVLKLAYGVIGFVIVYAPNFVRAKKLLWVEMAQRLPNLDHWCMIGDFNMI